MAARMRARDFGGLLFVLSLAGAAAFAACSDFPDVPDTAFVTGGGSPTTATGPEGGGGQGGNPATTTTTATTVSVVTTGPACVGTDADGDGVCVEQDDCDDNDPNVFPGQQSFFPTPRGDGSFDYDCDGQELKQFPNPCSPGGPCPGVVGFITDVACGQPGQFGDCATTALVCTVSNASERTQACR